MEIKLDFLPPMSKRRSGQKLDPVKYIVCHDTGNDGSTAQGNVNYYRQSAYEVEASAHAFVDDKGVIWCVPESEKAWHVRRIAGIAPNVAPTFANDCSIGIELCFGSTWGTLRNGLSYMNYVKVISELCKKYNLNPDKDLIQHAYLDPTRRTDPVTGLKVCGKTWVDLLRDVKATTIETPPVSSPSGPEVEALKVENAILKKEKEEVYDKLIACIKTLFKKV